MSRILRSYLKYARGEVSSSPWALLYPLQFLTLLWMKLRISCYDRGLFSVTEPPLPVVSIGNNSLGGTNKTPMTEHVVRQFHEAGIDAGLVSRGYRTKDHAPIWIGQDEESRRREVAGDEPLMLAKRLPDTKIVVSKDRVQGVTLLASLGAQVAVTDDTFQHRRMARDVDIVLVDATCPFGNGSVLPAGSMREPISAFSRADILVITKSSQVAGETLAEIKDELMKWVEPDKIFLADIVLESWLVLLDGREKKLSGAEPPPGPYIAFSAIGNPAGFYQYLKDKGVNVAERRSYRDHHIFTESDIRKLESLAREIDASGFICTEKDLVNIPEEIAIALPVYVPRISVALDDEDGFRRRISEKLKPRLMVASNGYGEDAIGVVLAKKMRERFKAAEVSAFTLVGSGAYYSKEDIRVLSPVSEMPSGGVIKYSVVDLFRDIRHGLGRSIRSQLHALHSLRGDYRTPVCVGDVYLLANILWGQGFKPLLVATAKSVHLSGHLSIERFLLRNRSRYVWTRDEETAEELRSGGVNAEFCGNPIMDLIENDTERQDVWGGAAGAKILLLPGSRPRAYEDIKLVLNAASELAKRLECSFVIVPALTLNIEKLVGELDGWTISPEKQTLRNESTVVRIFTGQVASAARGAELLIGLGGTANQLCAGLGVPVISIIETGKLRQKKLLREAEILVEADPAELANAAYRVMANPSLRREMQEAGKRHLGAKGALDQVVEYCASALGWDNRCHVYESYRKYLDGREAEKAAAKEML